MQPISNPVWNLFPFVWPTRYISERDKLISALALAVLALTILFVIARFLKPVKVSPKVEPEPVSPPKKVYQDIVEGKSSTPTTPESPKKSPRSTSPKKDPVSATLITSQGDQKANDQLLDIEDLMKISDLMMSEEPKNEPQPKPKHRKTSKSSFKVEVSSALPVSNTEEEPKEKNRLEQRRYSDHTFLEGEFNEKDVCIKGSGQIRIGNSIYYGKIEGGQPSGEGMMVFLDGPIWKGTFVQGKLTGVGEITTLDRSLWCQGTFKDNELHGYGKKKEKDVYYIGNFESGKLYGEGTIEWENGKYYLKGQFKEGKLIKGKGKQQLEDGLIYEGPIEYGHFVGICKVQFPDGRTYQGMVCNNCVHGNGKMTYPNGDNLEGFFGNEMGLLDCYIGCKKYANGDIYVGHFAGILQDQNGVTFVTPYGDMRHGKGKMTFQNGEVQEGIFELDKFKSSVDKKA